MTTLLFLAAFLAGAADPKMPADKAFDAPGGVKLVVRAQGPYDADVPLQVVCYFKHKPSGDTTRGAPVELDRRLGGVIASLRDRGEFAGDEGELLLLTPPKDAIKPKRLLLVGLGDEKALSLAVMERVGRAALREAARMGAKRVAFAPLLRDQGNERLATGEVESAVVRGVLLAYDTERRLQKQGLAPAYTLEEWVTEAGVAFFEETADGVRKGAAETAKAASARTGKPYRTAK